MALENWEISGEGTYSIVNEGEESGNVLHVVDEKYFRYKDKDDFTDCEVELITNCNPNGICSVFIRTDESFQNGYRFEWESMRHIVRVARIVDGVVTGLTSAYAKGTYTDYSNDYIHLKFRIDGCLLSARELHNNEWEELFIYEETDVLESGFIAFGQRGNTTAAFANFSNIHIY